jgi:hypothetical protein
MRDLINLLRESSENVRLYRGDSTKIDNFDAKQTSLYGLFGHGIYLTDNKRVANDYKSKGSDGEVLFRMEGAKNKQEIVRRWVERRAAKIDENGIDHSSEIAFWSSNVPYSDGGDWSVVTNDLRRTEREKRVAYAQALWVKMSRKYEVRKKLDGTFVIQKKTIGALAEFDVPQEVVRHCLDAEAEINHHVMDSIEHALSKHGDMQTARDIKSFIRQQEREGEQVSFREVFTNIGVDSPLRGDRAVLDYFISELQEQGYTGISYLGGITMGGGYKHRAYVFWDSDEINRYRVK